MAKRASSTHDILMPSEGVAFDIDRFDELLRDNGVVLRHYKSMLCPIGITDRFDIRTHGDHECSNGFLYEYAGDVTILFTGNGTDPIFEDAGIIDGSTTQVTLPKFYDNSDEAVRVASYDRFYIKDLEATVVHKQRFESHQSGVDKLEFLAETVDSLVDSRGIRYHEGSDFAVVAGNIRWLPGGKRPGFDPDANRGVVCSIRYSLRPHWYLKRIIHEIRVCRAQDPLTGEYGLRRLPMAALLQREMHFRNQARGEDDPREQPAPRSGGFGPR